MDCLCSFLLSGWAVSLCLPTRCGEIRGRMGRLPGVTETAGCCHQPLHRGRVRVQMYLGRVRVQVCLGRVRVQVHLGRVRMQVYFTYLVLKLEYSGITRSITWLLMPWLPVSPGHQQPWYWTCRINRSLCSVRKDVKHPCHLSVNKC